MQSLATRASFRIELVEFGQSAMIIQSNHSLEGRSMEWVRFFCCLALVSPLVVVPDGALYAQVPFYQGKTITVIVSSDAGGTSDLRVKSLVPYLQKYIAGNSTIVLEYMPGGGGRKAANHVFRTAKPDGFTIGSMGTTLLAAAIQSEAGGLHRIKQVFYFRSRHGPTAEHLFPP